MSGASDIYRRVTDSLIKALETGARPWAQPWRSGQCRNAVSGRPYSGINVLLTALHQSSNGYTSGLFLTYRQAHNLGGWIRQGEHGVTIVAYRRIERPAPRVFGTNDDVDESITAIHSPWFVPITHTVFAIEQAGGLPENLFQAPAVPSPRSTREGCEAIIAVSGAQIVNDATHAAYIPSRDLILIPPRYWFKKENDFYATLFHELVHWSGARHRLNRTSGKYFGDKEYAIEELVAEIGAAFLASRVGIPHVDQSASYLASWLAALRANTRTIFIAARAASLASDYLWPTGLSDGGQGTFGDPCDTIPRRA